MSYLRRMVLLGLDLGQQQDYSVLTAFETYEENKIFHYNLIGMGRFPLKTTLPFTASCVKNLVQTSPYLRDAVLVVDCTGVGRPVVDLFREHEINIIAVTIAAGNKAHWGKNMEVTVPKKELVSSLLVVLTTRRIHIAQDIKDIDLLTKELLNFKFTGATRTTYKFGATGGYHDDIVMSMSMPIWYGEYLTRSKPKLRIITGG